MTNSIDKVIFGIWINTSNGNFTCQFLKNLLFYEPMEFMVLVLHSQFPDTDFIWNCNIATYYKRMLSYSINVIILLFVWMI